MVETRKYIFNLLKRTFGDELVKREWNSATNSQDNFTRDFYCPQIDFAIGPFNTDINNTNKNNDIDSAFKKYNKLITKWHINSDISDKQLKSNRKSRCFIAIEIENQTGRKHTLGSLINASALGRIGVIVTENKEKYNTVIKIRRYLNYLMETNIVDYSVRNIIIVDEKNFLQRLIEYGMSGN